MQVDQELLMELVVTAVSMNYLVSNTQRLAVPENIDWWRPIADVVAKMADQDPAFVSNIYDHTEAVEKAATERDQEGLDRDEP